jgi:hypothetical protein
MFFLYISDIKNNTKYIYNSKPVSQENASSLMSSFYEKVKSDIEEECSFTEEQNKCVIYSETSNIKKGWVWNSTTVDKTILYELVLIPLYEQPSDNTTSETQTDDLGPQLETVHVNAYDIKPESQQTTSSSLVDTYHRFSERYLPEELDYNPFERSTCHYEHLPSYQQTLYPANSNNPFLNPALNLELRNRLQLPNFGLRRY